MNKEKLVKKTIRIGLIAAATIFAGIMAAPLASAQTTTPTERNQLIRCSIAQARLNTRITRVDAIKQTHTEKYATLQTRFDALVAAAEETEYDTTALLAAQAAVADKIIVFTDAAGAYTTALLATKNLSCGESDGAFATSVLASREALIEARLASLDVRKTFREQAIPALKDYATWLKDNTNTQDEAQ
jgi:hypothetical protein